MDASGNVPREERRVLCSYILQSSTRKVQLWDSILKPALLDRHVVAMESALMSKGVPLAVYPCPVCHGPLKWIDNGGPKSFHAYFKCIRCPKPIPYLKYHVIEAVDVLVHTLANQNTQIIATAFREMIQSLGPDAPLAEEPDNPFKKLVNVCNDDPNELKLGKADSVTVADIFEDFDVCEFPILYVADTSTIPPRYYFHVMKYKSPYYNEKLIEEEDELRQRNRNGNIGSPIRHQLLPHQEIYMVKEVISTFNMIMKPGSFMVFGKRLQELLPASFYTIETEHNFTFLPIRKLCELDETRKSRFDVTDNWDKIVENAIKICQVALAIASEKKGDIAHKEYYKYVGLHLTTALWLVCYHTTPFESMLYQLIFIPRKRL